MNELTTNWTNPVQIYSADQSASSFGSHPTTPVSSPPPLTSVNQSQWAAPPPPGPAHPVGVANTASPHYAERNLHLVFIMRSFDKSSLETLILAIVNPSPMSEPTPITKLIENEKKEKNRWINWGKKIIRNQSSDWLFSLRSRKSGRVRAPLFVCLFVYWCVRHRCCLFLGVISAAAASVCNVP